MNWLKARFETDSALDGLWLTSGSHVVAELAGVAGFDWVLLDMEHGLGDDADILRLLQVLSGTAVAAVVRVPAPGSEWIGRALDFGAAGIMVPRLDSAVEARAFVQALRYPPDGRRGLTGSSRAAGYGYSFKDYFPTANRQVAGIVQIETVAAVEAVDSIAAVDGVDGLFIGHSDLSLALGCYGQLEAPALQAAESAVLEACARHGKRAGLLLKAGLDPRRYREKGFSLLSLGTDIGCLKEGFARLLETVRRE